MYTCIFKSNPLLMVATNNTEFADTINKGAHQYFNRGLSAVFNQRKIRSFDEAADTIRADLIKTGMDFDTAELIGCVFSRAYITGVSAGKFLCEFSTSTAIKLYLHGSDEQIHCLPVLGSHTLLPFSTMPICGGIIHHQHFPLRFSVPE